MDVLGAMRVFVAVAEEGSVTGAACKLSISKAMASRTLQRLEEHLQVRLLNRTTRRISLTEAGGAYLDHARTMLDRNATFEMRIGREATTPSGRLRISAPISYGLAEVSSVLPDFMRCYPDVRIELLLQDRFVDLVEEGIDLAIRIGSHAPNSAIVTTLSETCHLLVASPDLIAARGEPQRVEDLHDWPLLEYSLRTAPHSWRQSQARPNVVLRSNNGEALLNGVLSGVGLAFLPEFFVLRHLQSGALTCLFAEQTREVSPIVALYPHREFLSGKTRAFLDYLRARLRDARA